MNAHQIEVEEVRATREEPKVRENYFLFKRILEVSAILIFSPLVLALGAFIALLIKLESRGPVFFKQKRIGKDGKIFEMIKFRSMTHTDLDELEDYYKADHITKVGRFIRRHRFDELPQFLNVLAGDMSLVGPRPDIMTLYRRCADDIPEYEFRLAVKPGITGWAQVNYNYVDDSRGAYERLKYDFYYIKNASLLLDLKIAFMTVQIMLNGKGSK